MKYRAKVLINKRNKQYLIMLSKKKLCFLKEKQPKFINIKKLTEEDFEF